MTLGAMVDETPPYDREKEIFIESIDGQRCECGALRNIYLLTCYGGNTATVACVPCSKRIASRLLRRAVLEELPADDLCAAMRFMLRVLQIEARYSK